MLSLRRTAAIKIRTSSAPSVLGCSRRILLTARLLSSAPAAGDKVAGTVKYFDKKRGFGMVTGDVDQKDYFFHRSNLAGFKPEGQLRNIYVENGEKVEYALGPDQRNPGKVKAVYVGGPNGSPLSIWKPSKPHSSV